MDELKNEKLKEIMKEEPENMTIEDQQRFFDELKKVKLLLPIEIRSDISDIINPEEGDVVQIDEGLRFKPIFIEGNGNKAIPLFTDDGEVEKAGRMSVIEIFTEDLANMFKEVEDVDEVIVNPNSEYSLGMPFNAFLNLFFEDEEIGIVNGLFEKAIALEEDIQIFFPEEEPFMKEDAINGIYSSELPFRASTNKNFKDLPYLNILLIPKTTKILYVGNIVDSETNYDILLAPRTEFQFLEENENEIIWKCIAQPFYDD